MLVMYLSDICTMMWSCLPMQSRRRWCIAVAGWVAWICAGIQELENRISQKTLPLPETREAQQARVKSSFKFFDTHESMLKRSEKSIDPLLASILFTLCLLWCPLLTLENQRRRNYRCGWHWKIWKNGKHAVESVCSGRTECGTGRNSAGRALVQKGCKSWYMKGLRRARNCDRQSNFSRSWVKRLAFHVRVNWKS